MLKDTEPTDGERAVKVRGKWINFDFFLLLTWLPGAERIFGKGFIAAVRHKHGQMLERWDQEEASEVSAMLSEVKYVKRRIS